MQLLLWNRKRAKKRGKDKPERLRPRAVAPKPRTRGAVGEQRFSEAIDPANPAWARLPMAERYERMTRAMLTRYGVRVRKWRTSMSGVAWQVLYHDGSVSRLIESPRPRGPMSAAVFLHEIGHHAIGFGTYRPRCLEEYHAWRFALDQMEAWRLNITPTVHARMHESLHYAIDKAERRGLKSLPAELIPFLRTPPGLRGRHTPARRSGLTPAVARPLVRGLPAPRREPG